MVGSRYSEENPPPTVVEEIRRRWATVCADWPRPLFEQVTARAAWIEFKYDRAMSENFKSMSMRATAYTSLPMTPAREESSLGSP